ncbi:MFS transporter [Sulfolobales archaeon HS-7]|nr:MFS transporter [Sulfolobales archaeon HS-7]
MPSERFNYIGAYTSWLMDSYDLGAVVITASILGKLFFPTLGLLGAVLPIVFTVITRPLGGFLFGYLADLRGRKFAFILTVLGYAASIGITAFLPTYFQVGIIAAVALSVLRLIQGIFIGGDVSSSFTIAMESVTNKRGLMAGILQSGTLAGFVIVDLLFTSLAKEPWFLSYGWRLIFGIGMIPAILALIIRAYAVEPKIYVEAKKENPFKGLRPIFQTLLVMIGFWVAIYAGPQYLSVFFGSVLHLSPAYFGSLLVIMNAIGIPAMILSGFLSDYIGRKTIAVLGSIVGIAIGIPFYILGRSDVASILAFGFGVNIASAISPVYLAERFRTFSRATGVGFAYNGAFIIAGFTQIYIALLSKAIGAFEAPAIVLGAGFLLAIGGLLAGPETLRIGMRN